MNTNEYINSIHANYINAIGDASVTEDELYALYKAWCEVAPPDGE